LKKKKPYHLSGPAVLLLAVYLLVFPHPCARELFGRPVWAVDLSAPGRDVPASGQRPYSWFRAGRQFGYFGLGGELYFLGETLYGVALCEAGFINYARVFDHIAFQDSYGNMRTGLKSPGYPILDARGERLFSVSTDASGLGELSWEGETLWRQDFVSPITSLAIGGRDIAVGLLSGTLVLIDERGERTYQVSPQGSRLPVILGTCFSGDNRHLAFLSGIDPTILTILGRRQKEVVSRRTLKLDSRLRREVRLQFSADDRFLLLEDAQGLRVLEVAGSDEVLLRLPAPARAVATCGQTGIAVASAPVGPGSTLALFRLPGTRLYESALPSREVTLKMQQRHLFIGIPGYLLRVDIVED